MKQRLDVLDEAVLGEEGLPLALALEVLEVADDLEHGGFLGREIRGGDEVGGDAVGEAGGLADVDDDALGVFHEVDARAGGKSPCF